MDVHVGEHFMYGGHLYMVVPISTKTSQYLTYIYEVDGETVFADTFTGTCRDTFINLGWTDTEIHQGHKDDWVIIKVREYHLDDLYGFVDGRDFSVFFNNMDSWEYLPKLEVFATWLQSIFIPAWYNRETLDDLNWRIKNFQASIAANEDKIQMVD